MSMVYAQTQSSSSSRVQPLGQQPLQFGVSVSIRAFAQDVIRAVDFYNEVGTPRREVDDVRRQDDLTAKPDAKFRARKFRPQSEL